MANSGQVIPPAEVDRLFQPFQRLGPRPARRDGHGHGLGLSIVGAIAATHAATITAQPRPGGGLAIDVTFPRHPVPAPLPASSQGAAKTVQLRGPPNPENSPRCELAGAATIRSAPELGR